MLTEVKNQFKVAFLSIKYSVMRELLNRVTFISNVVFMMLNNASMIIQWLVLFSLKENMGGYTFKEVLLLWGMASSTFGLSRFFFYKAFKLSSVINSGKLDSYIVQPKNVLISIITSDISVSALGDILYGYIMLIFYGLSIKSVLLFTYFIITGGVIITCISIILNSLSFWFGNTDVISDTGNSLMLSFATYPDGIFKGICKGLLFTLIPVGISNYIPVHVIVNFDLNLFLINTCVCIFFIYFAFIVFYTGLKRYNLMSSKI
jgi:ABC-2 type transport system permease protein